jgi:hypothetical protein
MKQKMKRRNVKRPPRSGVVPTWLLDFCAVFNVLAITPSRELYKTCRQLHWKVNLMLVHKMCSMYHEML